MTSPVTAECEATARMHYHWIASIPDGVFCVGCDEFVTGAWLRCSDKRAMCGACYEDPMCHFMPEVVG